VPEQGSFSEANAIWVFDGHFSDARPATRTPYICWPPAGFVPNAVVYPRWSFAHPNANFTNATVTMKSNGIPVSMIALEPLAPGYGENTLVWVPMNLDANDFNTVWPFNGTDTVYTVGVSNVIVTNVVAIVTNFNYTVTVFDPAVPGADYFPPVISGPSQPVVGLSNAYTFNAVSNATSYQWRYTSKTTFSLFDGAEAALANWSTNTSSNYSVIVSSPHPVASGTHAFYLCHTQAASQIMTLNSILYPRTNTTLNFKSELGYATSVQVARVQVSTNGGQSWVDVFSQAGDGGSGETTYSTKNISLASYAGKNLRLRFNYDLAFGGYYPQADVDVGWHFDDVTITNCDQLLTPVTNSTATTNFQFNPPQGGDYNLEVRTLIFTDFPLDWGPTKQVTAIVGSPVMLVNNLASTNNQVRIDFTLQSGSASTFKLLYANQITGGWSTDTLAVLTNVAGSSYRFTTTPGGAMRFYRIQSP
jgi:hypothetical protein